MGEEASPASEAETREAEEGSCSSQDSEQGRGFEDAADRPLTFTRPYLLLGVKLRTVICSTLGVLVCWLQ